MFSCNKYEGGSDFDGFREVGFGKAGVGRGSTVVSEGGSGYGSYIEVWFCTFGCSGEVRAGWVGDMWMREVKVSVTISMGVLVSRLGVFWENEKNAFHNGCSESMHYVWGYSQGKCMVEIEVQVCCGCRVWTMETISNQRIWYRVLMLSTCAGNQFIR